MLLASEVPNAIDENGPQPRTKGSRATAEAELRKLSRDGHWHILHALPGPGPSGPPLPSS